MMERIIERVAENLNLPDHFAILELGEIRKLKNRSMQALSDLQWLPGNLRVKSPLPLSKS